MKIDHRFRPVRPNRLARVTRAGAMIGSISNTRAASRRSFAPPAERGQQRGLQIGLARRVLPPYRVSPPFEASFAVAMVKDPQRPRPAAFVPIRRGQDRWWWVLTAGLLAGLLLYLFRHL